MHDSILDWFDRNALESDFAGRVVIELGSRWVNGGLRPRCESFGPKNYTGFDPVPGPGVDEVFAAEDVMLVVAGGTADTVIATETLHAAVDWQSVVRACHWLLKPGGTLFLTTRCPGAPVLDFPADFWRFQPGDLWRIFGGWDIVSLEEDDERPGVFVKVVRSSMPLADLSEIRPEQVMPLCRPRRSTASSMRSTRICRPSS